MQEFVSDAVVLSKEPIGELDIRVSLFTKDFGKLTARARSARKILSKLSAHLEPGNLVKARFVEKKGLQIVDALKSSRCAISLRDLHAVGELLAEYEPDVELWASLADAPFSWGEVLRTLGWDALHARCDRCEKPGPESFQMRDQRFFCTTCAISLPKAGLIYIHGS